MNVYVNKCKRRLVRLRERREREKWINWRSLSLFLSAIDVWRGNVMNRLMHIHASLHSINLGQRDSEPEIVHSIRSFRVSPPFVRRREIRLYFARAYLSIESSVEFLNPHLCVGSRFLVGSPADESALFICELILIRE